MGGKAMAIVGVETERKNTKDHLRIQALMVTKIEQLFKTEVATVAFFRNKESHGDVDLLIRNTGNLGNIAEILKENFGPVHSNGNVFSFEFEKYQIDVIPQAERYWKTAQTFFDWDPTGNLMGKIAHKFGLKYGFQGLVYPFRSFSGRLSKDITISLDDREIFKFLGFDYDTYLAGFNSVEDVFEYVINSKYFIAENFKMENLSAIDRKRNKKRKTYQEFLEYVNKKGIENQVNFTFSKDKDTYIDIIDQQFPGSEFVHKLEILKIKDKIAKQSSEMFNGRLVMELTDLSGKDLGKVLGDFKDYLTEKTNLPFSNAIVSDKNIMETFKQWYRGNLN